MLRPVCDMKLLYLMRRALSGEFNVVLLELPGFGWSYPRDPAALTFEAASQIIAAALVDLKLTRTVLVGSCVQGLVAARVAELVPEAVAGLVIAQTGDFEAARFWAREVLDAKGSLARPFEGQIGFRLTRERAAVDRWVRFAAGPNLPLERFQHEARAVLRSGCCYALASLLQKWNAVEPPRLQPKVPTAILWGLADRSHARTERRSVLAYAPDASYQEHNQLGHFPDLEEPSLIAELARDLLR